jgi:uncharacterized protein (DUF2147 family)
MKIQKQFYGILFFCLLSFGLSAQSIVGEWKTIDDETGKTKSIVKIYEAKNGKFYGKVVKILDKSRGENPLCDKCTDDRKDKPILDMLIVKEMNKSGDLFSGGRILDPAKGKEYSCKMWIENGNLKVRGYWGIFYRTQTWYKVN